MVLGFRFPRQVTAMSCWTVGEYIDDYKVWFPHGGRKNSARGGTLVLLRTNGEIWLGNFMQLSYGTDPFSFPQSFRSLRVANNDNDLCLLDYRQGGRTSVEGQYVEKLVNHRVLAFDKKGLGLSLALKNLHRQTGL